MRAVRLHAAGDLRIEDLPAPGEPAPGEVLLAVLAAGICGSDVHNFRTGQWLTGTPRIGGHEFSATVVGVGAGVDGLAPGDMVVADSRVWCGTCDACRRGRRNLCRHLGFVGEVCDGGFAPTAVLPARLVLRVPRGTDAVAAAMAEPLAVALHAIRRMPVPSGEPVLVAGCGPIGGLVALLLSRLHDGPVLISDRNAARAALVAGEAGATVLDLAHGARQARHAFDATGSVAAVETLVPSLDGGGGLCLVGISHGTFPLDPTVLVEREITLVGSHAFADELPEVVALLPALTAALRRFVDREIAIDETPAAYDRIIAGAATGLKTIIRPS